MQIDNLISVRIQRRKPGSNQLFHDLSNSHKNKSKELTNKLFYQGKQTELMRDVAPNHTAYNDIKSHFTNVEKEAFNDWKENHSKKMKSNIRLVWDGVITLGNLFNTLTRQEVDAIPKDQLERAFQDGYNAICNYVGVSPDNGYLIIHYDEAQVHAHYSIVGYNFNKHQTLNPFLKREQCSQLQDIVAKQFNDIGFKRGIKKFDKLDNQALEMFNKPYSLLNNNEKKICNENANTTHKSLKQLNDQLKDDVNTLQEALSCVNDNNINLSVDDNIVNEIVSYQVDIAKLQALEKPTNNPALKKTFNYLRRLSKLDENGKTFAKNLRNAKNAYKLLDDENKQLLQDMIAINLDELKPIYTDKQRNALSTCKVDLPGFEKKTFSNDKVVSLENYNKVRKHIAKQDDKVSRLNEIVTDFKPLYERKDLIFQMLSKYENIKDLDNKITKLQDEIKLSNDVIIANHKEMQKMNDKEALYNQLKGIRELLNENNNTGDIIQDIRNEIVTNRKTITQQKNIITDLRNENNSLRNENEMLRNDIADLEYELDKYQPKRNNPNFGI